MSPREVTLDDRVYDLEQALQKHSSSISILTVDQGKANEGLGDHNRRLLAQNEAIVLLRSDVADIQKARQARALEEVRREERETARNEAIDTRLKGIEDSIKSIYSLGKWVLAAFMGVIVAAVATFMINGGLVHVPTH